MIIYHIKKQDIWMSQKKFSGHGDISLKNRIVPGKRGKWKPYQ
jgi:hypothetical protein